MLSTENLSKSFGSLVAVDDVSLSVAAGSLHAIIGPNGAGKSTFFNLISGFFPPTRGRIVFDGQDVSGPGRHGRAPGGRAFPWRSASGGDRHGAGAASEAAVAR